MRSHSSVYKSPSATELRNTIEASRGERPCDIYIRNGQLINVYSGEIYPSDLAVTDDKIVYLGTNEGLIGAKTLIIDARDQYLSPGFVEPHFHPWALHNPLELAREALKSGTTSMVGDSLFFIMLMGVRNGKLREFFELCSSLPFKIFWSLRIAPQSLIPDSDELFSVPEMIELLKSDLIIGIEEITAWKEIIEAKPLIMDFVSLARGLKKRVNGHLAGCSYHKMNTAAVAVDSCHEAISPEEVLHRLRLGIHVMLRENSLRPDLQNLCRAITHQQVSTQRLMLTSDSPSPPHLVAKGLINHAVKVAIAAGVKPVTAYQMATINPAVYYGLDNRIGGLSPGKQADIILFSSLEDPAPDTVITNGKIAFQSEKVLAPFPSIDWGAYFGKTGSLRGWSIKAEDFNVYKYKSSLQVPVMNLVSAVITRELPMQAQEKDGYLMIEDQNICKISLIDRQGKWITNGYIKGFCNSRLKGLASTYNTAGEILSLGSNSRDMALAVNRAIQLNGGIVLAENGKIIYECPLEIGGFMSAKTLPDLAGAIETLESLLAERGYKYNDLMYTLFFFPADCLPDIRISWKGIYNIKTREILYPQRQIIKSETAG